MQDVTPDMIAQAAQVAGSVARHTDLLPASPSVFGGNGVYIKAENLQRTGSFKIRGASYRLSQLSASEKENGVVCASAGNHAQGVALAAKLLGVPATVVMPESAPRSKIEATRAYGADIVFSGHSFDQALTGAQTLRAEKGLTFIHAFDDPYIIAGQATVGLEILDDLPDCANIVVPVGGGGLAAGVALAAKQRNPRIRVVGVEPENAASMRAALYAGHAVELAKTATIADGVAVARAGDLTCELCRQWLDDLVTVSESDIAHAVLMLLERIKLVSEGAGAVALAAVLTGRANLQEGPTAAILSGGNIDATRLAMLIENG